VTGAPVFEGWGLHTGARASVAFLLEPGPVRLRQHGITVSIDALGYDGERRSTTATSADRRLSVGMVEHVFAALAAAGIRDGVVISVEGPEIPLVDGGARAFLDGLLRLDLPRRPAPLSVVTACTLSVGESSYVFAPPADGAPAKVSVAIDFDDPRIAQDAAWDGDHEDFRERIATARTFGFARDLASFERRGLARQAAPESVVLLGDDEIFTAGAPFRDDEPARHKLLDLVGDLYPHGGPPRGTIRAVRPGHAATHEAMRRAREEGLLEVRGDEVTRM
jgi:UDP-3-O-[3-hydroxymyristoyl] N-acetylglucosamine deacetylase